MTTKQVDKSFYNFKTYTNLKRWVSYWYQVKEILDSNPEEVLVIGIGDGIVIDCLKRMIDTVKTLDIDKDLNPDYPCSILNIGHELKEKKFDAILCCQVLEHLPFENFKAIIKNLAEHVRKRLVLSLPYSYNRIGKIIIPRFYKRFKFDGQHYWEIGTKGYPRSLIMNVLENYFNIEKKYLVPGNYYHQFYILSPKH